MSTICALSASCAWLSTSLSHAVFTAQNGYWLDNPVIVNKFLPAVLDTIFMTAASSFFGVLFGLPLGLILVATSRNGLWSAWGGARIIYQVLGFIVNVGRSLPFVILMIAVIPLTRFIMGTTLGWQAAIVPLTLAAVPFFARLVESNILGVDAGKIEAAKMSGASAQQIMWGVQVREALPALIQSVTVLVISLIGYSAMAGALGTGGLGYLALSYGYTQFMADVMVVTVIGILVLVMIVQALGDMLSRLVDHR